MLIPTDHSDLRVTWHRHRGAVVLSLWKGDACTGSAHLSAGDAAELAGFLVAHLGAVARATEDEQR